MKLDGLQPNGLNPLDRPAGTRKAEAKAGGKSFADALEKAQASPAPAAAPEAKDAPAPSMDSHMDRVRLRLQSGYYDNPKIADALSDKLSGFFDDVA